MPISVWFVRKDTGLPDDSMPEQILQSADEAVELVRAHKAGAHGGQHILRVSASRSALSRADRDRLIAAGAEVTM
jgi:hypothetical protein